MSGHFSSNDLYNVNCPEVEVALLLSLELAATVTLFSLYVVAFTAQFTVLIWFNATLPIAWLLLSITHVRFVCKVTFTLLLVLTKLVIVLLITKLLYWKISLGVVILITLKAAVHPVWSKVIVKLDELLGL